MVAVVMFNIKTYLPVTTRPICCITQHQRRFSHCDVLHCYCCYETDNAGLQERSKVKEIRRRVETALSYMLRRSHTDHWRAFARLTSALTDLQYIADGYDDYTSRLHVMSQSGSINIPALLYDVMSNGSSERHDGD